MAQSAIDKQFDPNKKDFRLTAKDFNQYRDVLVEFTRTYFPKTFNDFNSTSLGTMYIEQAAAVGDILSYYIDYSFKESLMLFAEERKNILSLARYLGYVPPASIAANTKVEVSHLVPAIGKDRVPDYRFALKIDAGMEMVGNVSPSSTATSPVFRTTEDLDFASDTEDNPRTVSVFQRDGSGNPEFYLLKKSVNARSAQLRTKTVSVGDPTAFFQITLDENNIIEILDVTDSDGNRWYEVPYLAQNLIFTEEKNSRKNNFVFSADQELVPFLLKSLKTPRKFIRKINAANITQLEFGSGTAENADELIVPNLNNIDSGGGVVTINDQIDPSNFLKLDTLGQAPTNVDLTVRYSVGGGVASNVISNTLTSISSINISNDTAVFSNAEVEIFNFIRDNVTVNNPEPATGGRAAPTDEEIRRIALGTIGSQNRAVTANDYNIRSMAMPARFGAVAKSFTAMDAELDGKSQRQLLEDAGNSITPETFNEIFPNANNPFAVNLYVLSFDKDRKLTIANGALIENLRNWLAKGKILSDAVNIMNAFIINVSVDFDITVFEDELKKDVLIRCIQTVQNYFDIDKWQINQPIDISELELAVASVKGVKSVPRLEIKNLNKKDGEYSDIEYSIGAATRDKVIYPSRDPCIFEVKFPNQDIIGKVV
jgi:hypothetical protein